MSSYSAFLEMTSKRVLHVINACIDTIWLRSSMGSSRSCGKGWLGREEIGALLLLQESYYYPGFELVRFRRAEKVLWSDESSVGWIPCSWKMAIVHTVPGFQRSGSKRLVSAARSVGEEQAEARMFVHKRSSQLSVANAKRQPGKC